MNVSSELCNVLKRDTMQRLIPETPKPSVSEETRPPSTATLKSQRRLITMHNNDGQSVFDKSRSTVVPKTSLPWGTTFGLCYATKTCPVEIGSDADLETYDRLLHASSSLGLTIHNGTVLRHVDIMPNRLSTMHRTVSIDYGVVLAGEVDLLLDSGEVERLNTGDIVVQRVTMHACRNPSKTNVSRMLFMLVGAFPLEVDGKILVEELGDLPIEASINPKN